MNALPSPWLDVSGAAAYLRVSEKTIYRAVASKAAPLRHARIGGRRSLRFRVEWLDSYLDAQATPVESSASPEAA